MLDDHCVRHPWIDFTTERNYVVVIRDDRFVVLLFALLELLEFRADHSGREIAVAKCFHEI